jgi:AcrR family transcriptional regulator
MTRTGTRRSETRLRLYQAAIALIAEQGFSATTVDQIADCAGVAKGTVYYNFASKTELFEELLRHGVGSLTASLQEVADAALAEPGGRAVDALDAMAKAGLGFISRHAAFTRLITAELWRTHRAWHPTLVSVRDQTVAVVADVLREGVKSRDFSEGLDVELTAGALVGMVVVAALDWQAFQPGRPLTEVHHALSLLLRGRLRAEDSTGDANGAG